MVQLIIKCIYTTLLSILSIFLLSCSNNTLYDTVLEGDGVNRKLSIEITSPSDKSSVSSKDQINTQTGIVKSNITIRVEGTIYDAIGIKRVELQSNNNPPISGTLRGSWWDAEVPVNLGKNTITARVISTSGAVKEDLINVYFVWKILKQYNMTDEFQKMAGSANVVYYDGYFYIMGGNQVHDLTKRTYRYHPHTNTDEDLTPLSTKIAASAIGVHSASNTITLISGLQHDSKDPFLESYTAHIITENLDISNITNPWNETNITTEESPGEYYGRAAAASGQIGNIVYIFGGIDTLGDRSDEIWAYNLDTGIPSKVMSTGVKLTYADAVVYDNKLWIFGGVDDSDSNNLQFSSSVYVYNPADNSFINLGPILKYKRYGLKAVLMGDKVYLMGGKLDNGYITDIVEQFNLTTLTSICKSPLPEPMIYLGAATDGEDIYIFSGMGESLLPFANRYIYDPKSDDNTNCNY